MKVRLSGTRQECAALVAQLPSRLAGLVEMVEVSDFYPNRGAGTLGRVYLELRFTPTLTVTVSDLTPAGGA